MARTPAAPAAGGPLVAGAGLRGRGQAQPALHRDRRPLPGLAGRVPPRCLWTIVILALDSATRNVSIALHDGTAVVAEHTWHSRDNHTIELAPAVQRMLKQARVAPHGLGGIAVTTGPGSFTGLRIGLGLAKGLALAHRTPLFGVPTFDALAHAQPPRAEPMAAVLQAGRGRIAAGLYRYREGAWQADGPPRIADWAALAAETQEPTYFCGEIDLAGAEALRRIKR